MNTLTRCLKGSPPPIKIGPPYDDFKTSPPPPHLFAPSSPINKTTMIWRHTWFPPNTSPLRQGLTKANLYSATRFWVTQSHYPNSKILKYM